MSVILVLIGFSVLVAGGFLAAFIWSVKDGQYDDEYGSAVRILFEDERPEEPAGGSMAGFKATDERERTNTD